MLENHHTLNDRWLIHGCSGALDGLDLVTESNGLKRRIKSMDWMSNIVQSFFLGHKEIPTAVDGTPFQESPNLVPAFGKVLVFLTAGYSVSKKKNIRNQLINH